MFMEKLKIASETGDGPVDAIFKCIKKLYPHDVNFTTLSSTCCNRRN